MIEPQQRRQAFRQGVAGVFAALAWLFLLGKGSAHFPPPQAGWLWVVVRLLLALGLALAIIGVWRLSVARDRRWDGLGIAAFGLLLLPGIPLLLLFLFMLLTSFLGGIFGGS
ncbi:MAG: hypothetical protein HYV95_05415 [Opitutae bacterium]|nr:hypothetical protein [Opitutae bacterium]